MDAIFCGQEECFHPLLLKEILKNLLISDFHYQYSYLVTFD